MRLLRPGTISGYYLPLVFTAVLMASSHSLIHAGLARTASPELAIATFALALSLVHVIEVPLHPLPQVVMSYADRRSAWSVILRFSGAVLLVVLVLHGIMVLTSLGPTLFALVYDVPRRLMEPVLSAYKLGILLSVAVAFRALWQGLLYRFGRTQIFGAAIMVRIVGMVGFLAAAIHWGWLHPALLGIATLLVGIVIEGLISAWGARSIFKEGLSATGTAPNAERKTPGAGENTGLVPFYTPLMVSSGAAVILMPLVQAGLARSTSPEEALAVFAVAMGLATIIMAPLNRLHKAVMTFCQNGAQRRQARRFTWLVGTGAALVMAGVVWTPLGPWVLMGPMGLAPALLEPTLGVLRILALAPPILAYKEYLMGLQLARRRSRPLAEVKTMQLVVTAVLMVVLIGTGTFYPAAAAAVAWTGGHLAGTLYLVHVTGRLPDQLLANHHAAVSH